MVVRHNMQAMNANRMLGITTGAMAGSTEKLSSGYKINRAADNAAGLAISEKMRKQIRGLVQASSNAEDGISCVQTAEGALAEVHDMLQRMNELAVQAATGTNSESDRQYIQDELDQLVTEIDRVSETTKFNEIYLLSGDEENQGTHDEYVITYKEGNVRNKSAKAGNSEPLQHYNYTGVDNVYFAKEALVTTATCTKATAIVIKDGDDITHYLNKDTNDVNEDYKAFTVGTFNAAADLAGGKVVKDMFIYDSNTGAITKLSKDDDMPGEYFDQSGQLAQNFRKLEVVVDTTVTAITWADVIETAKSKPQLYDSDGKEVSEMALYKYFEDGEYKGGLYTTSTAAVTDKVFADDETPNNLYRISTYISTPLVLKVANDLEIKLHVGSDSDETNKITAKISCLSSAGLGIKKVASSKMGGIGVVDDTGMNATDAIDVVAEALKRVSTQRSLIGAVQNRLEHTVKNLDNVVENTTDAESSIRDTDMADEMVNYSNNNVLVQAGQSMLAQTNQVNQGVLQLLG